MRVKVVAGVGLFTIVPPVRDEGGWPRQVGVTDAGYSCSL